jgi:predicted transcriptional regulator
MTPKKLLTDAELELMQALWDLKEATVRDVMNVLPKEKQWAYTTVATVFKVLEKKGFVSSRASDRAHTYLPSITRETYEAKTVRHLVKKVFRGEVSQFAMKLLKETKLSEEEADLIRDLLDKGARS